SKRRVPVRRALPPHPRFRVERRVAARDVRDVALQRVGRPAIGLRAGRRPPGQRRRGGHRAAREQLHAQRAAAPRAPRLRRRGDAPLVTLDGDGIVELFAWETEPGFALHILNYTNPNMTRGFFRRFYPIGRQRAAFTVPRGRKIGAARALRAGRALPFTQSGEVVRFDVPSVTDYEVIALT